MHTMLQLRDWLTTWLASNASAAWSSERERLEDLEDILGRLRPGSGRQWLVGRAMQMTGDPGRPGGQQTVFVVSNADDGGIYDSPWESRAQAVADALNALEAHLKQERA
jgi:hypothetical protein